ERELESLDNIGDQVALNRRDELDGQLVHLVPEVLAGQSFDVNTGQLTEGCRVGPLGEGTLAGGVTRATDGNQRQRLSDRQAVIHLRCNGSGWGRRTAALASPREMAVNQLGEP